MEEKNFARMKHNYTLVTAHTAVAAYKEIRTKYSQSPNPTQEDTNRWKASIDQAAADMMNKRLQQAPFQTIKVGSDGDKDEKEYGKKVASVKGSFGHSHYPVMEGVSDVVEGTTPASRREPGASSVIAVVKKPEGIPFGIRPTPKDVNYLMKFIGPPQINGVADFSKPHEENLRNIIEALDILPSELTQITMNPSKPGREVNQPYVDAARAMGVQVKLISVGDFMAGVRATMDPKRFSVSPVILVGRGGYEEGIMAGAAARALGGFMQAKEFDTDPHILEQNPILTLEKDLVPADPKQTLVSTTFITDDPWLGEPGILEENGKFVTRTMIISHEGIAIQRHSLQ
jgi:fructose-1,6-bisphosphatase/sedoheptulose 1,7-bisphosphatase-like protein